MSTTVYLLSRVLGLGVSGAEEFFEHRGNIPLLRLTRQPPLPFLLPLRWAIWGGAIPRFTFLGPGHRLARVRVPL